MKIFILTPRFALTGVPLAQIRFARALSERGHEVSLVFGFVDPAYQLPEVPNVRTVVWGLPKVRDMFFPLYRYLRSEKPDIVFSAEDHLNAVLLLAAIFSGSKAKISGSSRVNPYDTYSDVFLSKRWFLKLLSIFVMKRADALTCVSEDMVSQYRRIFSSSPHVCVYNIVDDAVSRERMREEVSHAWFEDKSVPVLVAAGRLAPWKGFSDLIEAVALVAKKRPVRLLLLGDGPQRSELEQLVDSLAIRHCVDFVGYVENPLKYFAKSDVFVLSSLLEGLPNVLVEAMMCGCTPVATDCPTGPREVLRSGRFGYLVPVKNPVALALGIESALDVPIARSLLEEAIVPFQEARVVAEHFRVLGFTVP